MNDVDIENNKNKLDVNNILYGINNEVYTIESLRPNSKKITSEDIDLILSSYSDEEKSLED